MQNMKPRASSAGVRTSNESATEATTQGSSLLKGGVLGRSGSVSLGIWGVASLFLACHFADHYLLLVWFYGFVRVYKEGLHFAYVPSSHSADDYIVSNGDHISIADAFISVPMALAVWLMLIFAGYVVIKRLSFWKTFAPPLQ